MVKELFVELSHLEILIIPVGRLGFDSDYAALHIMHIVLILFECHRDDSDIHLLVDTLALQSVLQDDVGLVTYLLGLLYRLYASFHRLYLSHLRAMTHEESEELGEINHSESGRND